MMGKKAGRIEKRKGFLGVSAQEVANRKADGGTSKCLSACQ